MTEEAQKEPNPAEATPPAAEESAEPEIPQITFDDFGKVELRTAKVLEAAPHPNADRLFVLQVDGGSEKRQIVAGIRGHYEAEELVGKTIVIVWNLKPAKLRGEVSQGMLLAVSDGDTVSVLSPDKSVSPGGRVS